MVNHSNPEQFYLKKKIHPSWYTKVNIINFKLVYSIAVADLLENVLGATVRQNRQSIRQSCCRPTTIEVIVLV